MSVLAVVGFFVILAGGAVVFPRVEDWVARIPAPGRRGRRRGYHRHGAPASWSQLGVLHDNVRWTQEVERRAKDALS